MKNSLSREELRKASVELDRLAEEIIKDDPGAYELSPEEPAREIDVTPRDMLKFAKHILLFLGITFVISGVVDSFRPGSAFFEACKISLPSLATLVIGYYFGTSK